MKILFAHQNFPGQFKHLCMHLAAEGGHELVFMTNDNENRIDGVTRLLYDKIREPAPGVHHYISEFERGILLGQAAARVAQGLKERGFRPDVVIGHNGWGETLFLKDIYPDVPVLSYFEFFYRPHEADCGFDPELPMAIDDDLRVRAKNSINLVGWTSADWGLAPTAWQRSRYPQAFQERISVIHEGVDTDALAPAPDQRVTLKDGRSFGTADQVITYVSRNLEPYRGFHTVMRALPEILARHPQAIVLMVGGDDVSYGRKHESGRPWREVMLDEVKVDPARVMFLGKIPYSQFVALLRVSAAHIYLTYPFVLSWSMLEAMACGCAVVGSRTEPVAEAISDGRNGLLVDFFDPKAVADAVSRILTHPDRMAEMRRAARQTIVERYDLRRLCLPQTLALIDQLAHRRRPTVGMLPVTARPGLLDG